MNNYVESVDNMAYYDGNKLLNLKDINGERPELYICTTNRSAGKTTYFNRLVVNRYIKKKEKFVLLYRNKYELDNVAAKFFGEIGALFFPTYKMSAKTKSKGAYTELKLNDQICGYAVSLNGSEQVRKHSHIFRDCTSIIFDEFQPETNIYLPDEIVRFQSVHTSIARGGGAQSRYVPIYMISNFVTLLNPYYSALDIISRLNSKANYIRGAGWVLEQSINDSAADSLKESAFNRAFSKSSYITYATEKVYLNDDYKSIEKLNGKGQYILTILYAGESYGMTEAAGKYYIKSGGDITYPSVYRYDKFSRDAKLEKLRYIFQSGIMVFDRLETKRAMIELLRL